MLNVYKYTYTFYILTTIVCKELYALLQHSCMNFFYLASLLEKQTTMRFFLEKAPTKIFLQEFNDFCFVK